VLDGGAVVRLKLVPRVDYSKDDKKKKEEDSVAGEKRKKAVIPPQKLFNPDTVPKSHYSRSKHGGYIYQNEEFDREGYLEKDFKVTTIDTENVSPTLEEITRFSGGSVNDKNADLNALNPQSTAIEFQIGDNVEVARGEMKDLSGKIVGMENGIVTVMPSKETHLGAIKFDAKDLRKKFEEGDHVQVINGVHARETGLIIKIVNNVITVLTDATLKPVRFRRSIKIYSVHFLN
jgi:transcription elongation factor SPT5